MKLDFLKPVAEKLAPVAAKATKMKPELMIGGGIFMLVGGTVLACKATLDARKEVDETLEAVENVENPADKTVEYAKLGVSLASLYAPAALAIAGGTMLVVGGRNELRARLGMLGAAYATLDTAYSKYREHVVDEYGEEADRKFRLGISKEKVEEVTTTKSGKEKVTTKVVETVHSDGFGYSMYARYFDAFNSNEHVKSQAQNYDFLLLKQSWANERLQRRGFLFLNEVYEELGFDYIPEGWLVGWKLGNGDGFVDFGIFEARNSIARDAVRYNGNETCFVLDFNVDGPIWDIV